jgi:hypothetical protein
LAISASVVIFIIAVAATYTLRKRRK